MIEITCNDRLGKKVRVKCKYPPYIINRVRESRVFPYSRPAKLGYLVTIMGLHLVSCVCLNYPLSPDDTIGDLKKLVAAQTGTKWEKIVLKKW